jgi:hypothetical protein
VPAVRTSVGASIRRIESLPGAGRKIPTHRPTRDTSLGADTVGWTPRRTDHLCRHGTVRARHCRPGDHRSCHLPGGARVCSSPCGTAVILLREVTGDPCRDDLRQTTGRGKRLHQSWNLGWRRFKA